MKRWNLICLDLGRAGFEVGFAENPIARYLPLCRVQCRDLCWAEGDGAFGPLRTHFHWHLSDGCNESAIQMHGIVYDRVSIRVVLLFAWNADCYCVYVFPLGFQLTSKNDLQFTLVLKIVTLTEKFSARYNIISQLGTIEFKSRNHTNPPFPTVFHLKELHFQTCFLHPSYNTQLSWSDQRNPTWKHYPDNNYSYNKKIVSNKQSTLNLLNSQFLPFSNLPLKPSVRSSHKSPCTPLSNSGSYPSLHVPIFTLLQTEAPCKSPQSGTTSHPVSDSTFSRRCFSTSAVSCS